MAGEADRKVVCPPDQDRLAADDDNSQSSFTSEETQNGVKNIEAISQTWTRRSLIVAYLG